MVEPSPFPPENADLLVRQIRNLLDANETAAAGHVIHLLRLRFPDHPQIEELEDAREALYHPEPEEVSLLEQVLQSLPSARLLGALGGLVMGVGGLLLIAHEVWPALGLALIGILVIVVAVFRGKIEDAV